MSSSRSKVMIGFITVSHFTAVVLCCEESSLSVHYDHPHAGFRITGSMIVCYSVKGKKITFTQPVPNLINQPRPVGCLMFISLVLH